jgi:hypothetical protein
MVAMSSNTLFWGVVLVLIGVLMVLNNMDLLPVDVWSLIWPIVIIAAGIWVLWAAFFRKGKGARRLIVPLDGASRGRLHFSYGAGRLQVHSGAGSGNLAEGDFGEELQEVIRRKGYELGLDLVYKPHWLAPFGLAPGTQPVWDISLNQDIPLILEIETNATENTLNLSDLHIEDLWLKSGASSNVVFLPANAGFTQAEIKTGAASLVIHVPYGVAARILYKGGLSSIQIDSNRFPYNGNVYQSPDYEISANKVDLKIHTGVGSVDIRSE